MHMLEQHMGQDHVSAQDQADENMAQFGSGTYLTKYKDAYPTVEMTSANQLTIGTGSLLVNGRHCIIDTPEVLTVDNGSSGMTERDLVCVHWKEVEAEVQAASGDNTQTITKEEVDLVIVKGTPASSGATDPEISQDTIRSGVGEAWVPFARITKDGLTPSVAFTVDKMAPESEFRDSISQLLFAYYNDGTWGIGQTKTITGSSNYNLFVAFQQGGAVPMFGYRIPMNEGGYAVRFGGNYVTDDVHTTYGMTFTVNGDSWHYDAGSYLAHNPSGNHGSKTNIAVGRIYGIL